MKQYVYTHVMGVQSIIYILTCIVMKIVPCGVVSLTVYVLYIRVVKYTLCDVMYIAHFGRVPLGLAGCDLPFGFLAV